MGLILYGLPLSPFVRKAEVVMREKGIEFEEVPANIMPMPDWFKEISPARRIPVLRDTDVGSEGTAGTIPDSSAICAYLERKFPEPSLYPSDPFDYARALWLEEYADSELAGRVGMNVFRPIVFARFQGKEPDVERARKTMKEELPRLFDYLEGELQGREFAIGSALSIADIAIASQLAQLALAVGPLDGDRWPALRAHHDRMVARPSFAANLAICRKIVKSPVDLGP